MEIDPFEWNFVSRTCLENNKSVRCQLIQLTFSNALKPSPRGFEPPTPRLGERTGSVNSEQELSL